MDITNTANDITAMELLDDIISEEEIGLPPQASEVFKLWMVSENLGEPENI